MRYAYFVKCTSVEHDDQGKVTVVHCTHDPLSRGGQSPDGRKVKSTIHWVSARHAIPVEVRLFDRLFKTINPNDYPEGGSWKDNLNPNSLTIIEAQVEPSFKACKPGFTFQLERLGYFTIDEDSTDQHLVFNRTATLRDTWAKVAQKQ